MKKSLFDVLIDKKTVILNIKTDKITKERLHSFGLLKGAKITYVKSVPLRCPRIYQIQNTYVAIRTGIAKQIEVINE